MAALTQLTQLLNFIIESLILHTVFIVFSFLDSGHQELTGICSTGTSNPSPGHCQPMPVLDGTSCLGRTGSVVANSLSCP